MLIVLMEEIVMGRRLAIPEIPPGEYLARVTGVDLNKAKKTGQMRAWLTLEIAEGELKGVYFPKVQMLVSPNSIAQFLREWSAVGIHMQSYEELRKHLGTVQRLRIRVRIVHGNRPSCYFLAGEETNDVPSAELLSFEEMTIAAQDGPDNKRLHYTAEQTGKLMATLGRGCDSGPPSADDPKFIAWQKKLLTELIQEMQKLQAA